MANLKDSPKFEVHNDYYTPEYAWTNIKHIIPNDKIVWEACMLNSEKSKSAEYLDKLCKEVVFDNRMNMLEDTPENYDLIITNPPFESKLKQSVLKRLVDLDKPFIIILNSLCVYANYMREIFKDNMEHLQIVNPRGKIHFEKLLDNGELLYKPNTSFYCIYLCYKMNISNNNLWLK